MRRPATQPQDIHSRHAGSRVSRPVFYGSPVRDTVRRSERASDHSKPATASGLLTLAAVLTVCVAAAPAALADGGRVGDPRDGAKESIALDIASVGHSHSAQRLTHRLNTYRPWRPALLANGGQISFYLNSDADTALERQLDVRYVRGRLSAVMKDGRERLVGRGLVRRLSRRAVVVTFTRSLLPAGIRGYRWFAFAGGGCRRHSKVCGDRAPNGGRLVTHTLRSEPEPRPIAGQGYSRVLNEDFDTLNRTLWANRQWWERRPPANSIYVHNGTLHVVSRRSHGYPDVTISSEPHGTGKGRSFRQGYFEARMRWTGALGSGPAFWLFSTAHATNRNWPRRACPKPTCLTSEIDVFEGYGHRLDVFSGTIHRNTSGFYGVPDEINSNSWQPQRPGTNLAADYHVYAVLWTATEVSWYLDGRFLMSWPVYDSTNQRMHLLFYNWRTPWEPENQVGPTTPDELHTEVDWVRVWQK
jgi:hypothetical protein